MAILHMGDHDDLPLTPRSADTKAREQGDRETWLGAAPLTRLPSPWNVGDRFGDFQLEKYLGEGSSGYVYRALDCVTHRRYALKFVCNDPAESLVRTKLGFRRMMRVEHPNLARADRIHRCGNQIALSMEEICGDTFGKSLYQLRDRPLTEACRYLLQLMRDYASALAAIHNHCFIHRDIKPQNLMIDEHGRGRIIDYGLVGTFDADINPSGLRNYLVGTHGYIAPEAFSKQCYLPAGDLYCLGRVMLKALRAISGDNLVAIEPEELDDEAYVLKATVGNTKDSAPRVLYEACIDMLQPSPGDRPTASQVARHGLTTPVKISWPDEKPIYGRDHEYATICDWTRTIYAGGKGRLHLYGPSGIGKTRLIDEVEKYLQLNAYGQVFRARCRAREVHPFHAFDQIVDEIANRYMKNDLQRSRVDPVSAGILHDVFPALKSVVAVNLDLPTAGMRTVRLDSLEAASRLSVELRKNGPLILVIDDSQWADPDSVAVLDRLRDAPGGSLGIITISRTQEDGQHRSADVCIELRPLAIEESLMVLAESARRWSVEMELRDLNNLAQLIEGNPFRLSELSQEFRPGGLLAGPEHCAEFADSIVKGESLHWLCQRRVERLSPEARLILPLIVAAGCAVSLDQLDHLSGLGEHVDAPVSELVQQRLVADEAIGSECIRVTHDRISDGLIAVLQPSEIMKAHRLWADWLLRQSEPHLVAARVAGHLFDADEPSRAISSAILAAKQSERVYAYRDAGRWYARILPLVSGSERIQCLRDAARCFEIADLPVEAAQYYQELAKFVDTEERIECLVTAIGLLIRSGRFKLVRNQLRDLTRELKLPRPKGPFLARVSILWQVLKLGIEGRRQRRAIVKAAHAKKDLSSTRMTTREQQRLSLCLELARPLSLFDNLHASELNLFAARLSNRGDDVKSQLYIAIGSAVFGCYDKGPSRIRGETLLQDLRPRVVSLGDDKTLGDYWAASAFIHMFACRWHLVCERVERSLSYYNNMQCSRGFETSNTQSNCVWAQWHLGRWCEMSELHDSLLSESIHRNDLFQRLEASLGLIANRLACTRPTRRVVSGTETECRKSIEEGRGTAVRPPGMDQLNAACDLLRRLRFRIDPTQELPKSQESVTAKKLPTLSRDVPLFCALVSMHRMRAEKHPVSSHTAQKFIDGLRAEKLHYTTCAAAMFDGLHCLLAGRPDVARGHLQTANDWAATYRLRPIQNATSDALAKINTGQTGDLLQDRMRRHGVVKPHQFERLYTVRID